LLVLCRAERLCLDQFVNGRHGVVVQIGRHQS
jgi:hypothetical protein